MYKYLIIAFFIFSAKKRRIKIVSFLILLNDALYYFDTLIHDEHSGEYLISLFADGLNATLSLYQQTVKTIYY